MQNKQSSVSGFVHLLKSAAARQVEVKEKAQALTCLDQAGIEALEDKWNWSELSKSNEVLWWIALIEQFKDQWKWKDLSTNSKLPWSAELIEYFKQQWKWKDLSSNSELPWSVELIERFKDQWKWKELSASAYLPWSAELIEQFKDRWDWEYLSYNHGLPWSAELIEQFDDDWVMMVLYDNSEACKFTTNNPFSDQMVYQICVRFPFTRSCDGGASRPDITDFSEEELSDPRACFSLILSWEPEEMGNQDEDDWDEGELDYSEVKIERVDIMYDGVTPIDDNGEIGYWFENGQLHGYPAPIVFFTFNQKVSAKKFIAAINRSSFQILTAAMREKKSEPYIAEDHNGYVCRLDLSDWKYWLDIMLREGAVCCKVSEFPDGLPSYGHAFAGTDFILERQSWIKH